MKSLTKNDLIRQLIDENTISGTIPPSRTIARMAMEKWPDVFNDIENTRSSVRLVTGSMGEKNKKHTANKEYFNLKKWHEGYAHNPLEDVWRTPFQIPVFETLTIAADFHSVFVDHKSLDKFLKIVKNKEALLINGDLLDSQSLTRHLKTKNIARYEDEIEMSKQLLQHFKSEFNHVYFKEGNHDYWLERYVANVAPEIGKLKGFTLPEILGLAGMGVHHIHNLQEISYGEFTICHGHEFPMGFVVPNRPALSFLRKWIHHKRTHAKLICSHVHQADEAIEKTYDGKISRAWTTPAMCLKAAEYARFTRWDNGHTEVYGGTDCKNIVY